MAAVLSVAVCPVFMSAQFTSTQSCASPADPLCSIAVGQTGQPAPTMQLPPTIVPSQPITYSDAAGSQRTAPPTPPVRREATATTEFEQWVADSVGRKLPIYGISLFDNSPTTFAPVESTPVPSDYVIGPGDELNIRLWGPVLNVNARTTVDRNGEIYLPQVGMVPLAGVKYSQLDDRLRSEISRNFKNFQLAASLSRLRTVQVFVVGEAYRPGQYTISSLSTLVNAVFASGGPTSAGSLRHIQLRRGAQVVTELDLYELIANGDKSKDVPIQPGDVIYFPPAVGFAAVAGSVGVPAIYELAGNEAVADLIKIAGGPTVVADEQRVSLERIDGSKGRSVMELSLSETKSVRAQKGDIVRLLSVVPKFENAVTLRGNVANPGRYRWTPGMKILDLIPNAEQLLTRRFWLTQAGLTSGTSGEYPVRQQSGTAAPHAMNAQPANAPEHSAPPASATTTNNRPATATAAPQTAVAQPSVPPPPQVPNESTLISDIRSSAPEINWDYALIQRVNPVDLTTQLIPFNLRKAVIDKDESANLQLQSGDIITIFSQRDVAVPQQRRTQFIKVEGEVGAPGVYRIEPGDTLQTIVERAGGLTTGAYLYGAQLTRSSVRIQQQQRIEEFISFYTAQMKATAAAVANGNPDRAGILQLTPVAQEQIVSSLRDNRSLGRVVLRMSPIAKEVSALPAIALEDGDQLTIPARPAVISVVGSVFSQGSFLHRPNARVKTYLELAGRPTQIADKKHIFVIRADGSVLGQTGGTLWSGSLDNVRLYPGDTVVVPSKLQVGMFQRNLQAWTQIASQLALTGASLAVVTK